MDINPMNFNGQTFLVFYSAVLVFGIFLQVAARFWILAPPLGALEAGRSVKKPLSPYQLAYLRGKAMAVGQVGMAELLSKNLIEAHVASGRFRAKKMVDGSFLKSLDDVPATLLRACQSGSGLSAGLIPKEIDYSVQRIRMELERMGLVYPPGARLLPIGTSLFVFGSITLLGIGKVSVGLDRGKPIGFLVLLIVATVLTGIVLALTKHLNTAGQQRLEESRRDLKTTQSKAPVAGEAGAHHDGLISLVAMNVALQGIGTAGEQYMIDPNAAQMLQRAERSSASSAGCGTGCGGGGGGGCGGGGGGGCGGCGGGD